MGGDSPLFKFVRSVIWFSIGFREVRGVSGKGCLISAVVGGIAAVGGAVVFLSTASSETLASVPGTTASDLSQRCRARQASACTAFASTLERERARGEIVRSYYMDGCTLGDPSACETVMSRCETGGDWIVDDPILQIFATRCETAGGRPCKFVVEHAGKTKGNEELVRKAAGAGCEHDDFELCEQFGLMARQGKGGSAQPTEARRALEKACSKAKRAEACNVAAIMEASGSGGAKDLKAAVASSAVACDAEPGHCWNAGEYEELVSWAECSALLKEAESSDVKVSEQPVLEQNSHAVVTSYTTPDRYESVLKERGIFFRQAYVETTRIPGRTYTNTSTKVDRYAAATMLVKNESCAPVQAEVELTFEFDGWDSLKRGALAGALTYFLAKASGANDKDSEAAALGLGIAAGAAGLSARKTVTLAPNQEHVLGVEVDTQSLFGNNRKMKTVKIRRFELIFPEGSQCKPQCLSDLRDLSGNATSIRAKYQRACSTGSQKPVCEYLQAIRAGFDEEPLRRSCNNGKAPNLEAACSRIRYARWLARESE